MSWTPNEKLPDPPPPDEQSPFQRAVLETTDGRHVVDVPVPIFKPPADVLIWGQRFFKLHGNQRAGLLEYRECMAWVVGTVEQS